MASLRARLIAALLAACAGGLLLVGAITYLEQRSFQYDRVDDQARAAVMAAQRVLGGGPGFGPGGGRGRPDGPGPRGGPDGGVPPAPTPSCAMPTATSSTRPCWTRSTRA